MKKLIITSLLIVIVGVFSMSDKKLKLDKEIPSIQIDRAEKIESYKTKKDVAWHKPEYNKVLKYLNKRK